MLKKEKRKSIASQYSKRTQFGEIWHRLKKNKGAMVGLAIVIMFALIAIFADVMFDYDTQIAGYNLRAKLLKPCWEHPFGTDDMGRDLFARLLYGTRFSMAIAFSSVFFGVGVGVPSWYSSAFAAFTILSVCTRRAPSSPPSGAIL